MNVVDEYLKTVTPGQRAVFQRIGTIVAEMVPDVQQGMSYAMAAYTYKGKALLSFVANRHFLSVYPFSGKVVDRVEPLLEGYEHTTGSIHFSEEKPLTEELIRAIISARLAEIEK